jgi:hypothetical protein
MSPVPIQSYIWNTKTFIRSGRTQCTDNRPITNRLLVPTGKCKTLKCEYTTPLRAGFETSTPEFRLISLFQERKGPQRNTRCEHGFESRVVKYAVKLHSSDVIIFTTYAVAKKYCPYLVLLWIASTYSRKQCLISMYMLYPVQGPPQFVAIGFLYFPLFYIFLYSLGRMETRQRRTDWKQFIIAIRVPVTSSFNTHRPH